MKANELTKKSVELKSILQEIKTANDVGYFKHYVPHWIYVDAETQIQLINLGYKVYKGDWDAVIINCLIIEW